MKGILAVTALTCRFLMLTITVVPSFLTLEAGRYPIPIPIFKFGLKHPLESFPIFSPSVDKISKFSRGTPVSRSLIPTRRASGAFCLDDFFNCLQSFEANELVQRTFLANGPLQLGLDRRSLLRYVMSMQTEP